VLAYLAGFTGIGLATGAKLTLPYLVIVAALVVVVARLDARYHLGTAVLWALAIWGCAHMAGGVVHLDRERILYNAVFRPDLFRYDRLVHAFGFGSATVACGRILRHWLPGGRFDTAPLVLVVLAGMGVGGINEVFEFSATLLIEDTNVGGYDNTGWDLVFDLAGAIVAGTWLRARAGRSVGRHGRDDVGATGSRDHADSGEHEQAARDLGERDRLREEERAE
jgi:hypothetical protein